jgi:hypothetical protein
MTSSIDIVLNPDVVCSTLDNGGVLLDLETKQYFALNATGLLVWQYLEDGGSLASWAPSADRSSRGDLDAFARSLVAHGLATQAAADGDGAATMSARLSLPEQWTAPTVTPHGRPLSQVILSPFDPTVPIPE